MKRSHETIESEDVTNDIDKKIYNMNEIGERYVSLRKIESETANELEEIIQKIHQAITTIPKREVLVESLSVDTPIGEFIQKEHIVEKTATGEMYAKAIGIVAPTLKKQILDQVEKLRLDLQLKANEKKDYQIVFIPSEKESVSKRTHTVKKTKKTITNE